MANVSMANVFASVANAVANAVEANGVGANGVGANGVGANGVGANGVGANGVGANGVGANGLGKKENITIFIKKWHLAANGNITTWVPHNKHNSVTYEPLSACYTGHTNGYSTGNGIMVDYEYTIPLTQLKQRKVKWQWQGLYKNEKDIIIEFNLEQHVQEEITSKPDQMQSLKEINDIINKLNEPPKAIYIPHNFRISEGIVLCQHCGGLLSELKKTSTGQGCMKELL